MEVLSRHSEILERIKTAAVKAERKDTPELIAVSKFQSLEKILILYQDGQRVFGENYVQELIEKSEALQAQEIRDLSFHFIGHLQSNKVKLLLPHCSVIHSVDSWKLLSEIEKQAGKLSKKIRVCLQVNVDREESKNGFLEEDLKDLSTHASSLQWVEIAGLMTIPDPNLDSEQAFRKLSALSKKYAPLIGPELSMGMSDDFELAIKCGATSVRVGSALFGARDKPAGQK